MIVYKISLPVDFLFNCLLNELSYNNFFIPLILKIFIQKLNQLFIFEKFFLLRNFFKNLLNFFTLQSQNVLFAYFLKFAQIDLIIIINVKFFKNNIVTSSKFRQYFCKILQFYFQSFFKFDNTNCICLNKSIEKGIEAYFAIIISFKSIEDYIKFLICELNIQIF